MPDLAVWKVININITARSPTDDLNAVDKDLPQVHRVTRPAVYFTDLVFKHSRSIITSVSTTTNTSNDGL